MNPYYVTLFIFAFIVIDGIRAQDTTARKKFVFVDVGISTSGIGASYHIAGTLFHGHHAIRVVARNSKESEGPSDETILSSTTMLPKERISQIGIMYGIRGSTGRATVAIYAGVARLNGRSRGKYSYSYTEGDESYEVYEKKSVKNEVVPYFEGQIILYSIGLNVFMNLSKKADLAGLGVAIALGH